MKSKPALRLELTLRVAVAADDVAALATTTTEAGDIEKKYRYDDKGRVECYGRTPHNNGQAMQLPMPCHKREYLGNMRKPSRTRSR